MSDECKLCKCEECDLYKLWNRIFMIFIAVSIYLTGVMSAVMLKLIPRSVKDIMVFLVLGGVAMWIGWSIGVVMTSDGVVEDEECDGDVDDE